VGVGTMKDGGSLRITNKKKGERAIKQLLKQQTRAQIDATMPEIPDAAKVIEKLQKRVKKLEDGLKMRENQFNLLWKWYKESGGN